jgi:ATP-dependent protease HslVU (ClpYQ) peptidase subunit
MTCIVGMRTRDGRVFIGGDTLGVGGYSKTLRMDGKVFAKGDMIFGFTTSYRMGQIIRYTFSPPSRPEGVDDMTYLVATFIPSLMTAFRNGQFLTKTNEVAEGGTFLLGYKNELYKIDSDFQVGIAEVGYDACGCGEAYAKGAMHVLWSATESPDRVLTKALEAAMAHSAGVGGRVEIVELEK